MKSVFEANPEATELFVFEDGNAFVKQNHADGYALQSKQTYKIVKKEVETTKKETTKK